MARAGPAAAGGICDLAGSALLFLRSSALGTAGGAIFFVLTLPLPWMLGPMAVSALATIAGVRVHVDDRLRRAMFVVLGVMIGSTFSPQVLAQAAR